MRKKPRHNFSAKQEVIREMRRQNLGPYDVVQRIKGKGYRAAERTIYDWFANPDRDIRLGTLEAILDVLDMVIAPRSRLASRQRDRSVGDN